MCGLTGLSEVQYRRLQGVRALKHKRKAYTTEGKVLTLALESKGFQGNELADVTVVVDLPL